VKVNSFPGTRFVDSLTLYDLVYIGVLTAANCVADCPGAN